MEPGELTRVDVPREQLFDAHAVPYGDDAGMPYGGDDGSRRSLRDHGSGLVLAHAARVRLHHSSAVWRRVNR